MIRSDEQFRRAARELSLLFAAMGAADAIPGAEVVLEAGNAVDDLVAYAGRAPNVVLYPGPHRDLPRPELHVIEGGRP